MSYEREVIDLVDVEDDEEAEYDSIPLPDDIEAIENDAGPSRRSSNESRYPSKKDAQSGIDIRQGLKEQLAKLDAEVSPTPCQQSLIPRSCTVSQAKSMSCRN